MLHDIALPALSDCTFARWSPGIGDPSVMGWVTVAVYVLSAVLCARPAVQGARAGRVRLFWAVLAVGLGFLAVNKQLDLQSFLTAVGRCVAKLQGWYGARRTVQLDFIIGLLLAVILCMALCAWAMRRHLREIGVALTGLTVVLAFVSVRAVGFHHVDALIGYSVADVRANWVLELTGPLLIALNAITAMARPPEGAGFRRRRARR